MRGPATPDDAGAIRGRRPRHLRAASALAGSLIPEVRVSPTSRPLTDAWRRTRVAPRRSTLLGLSFRPRQCEALGLEPFDTLRALLKAPFDVVRLAAYWNSVERTANIRDHGELDWQLAQAERAGRQVIVCVGAVKAFGYPEYFVPDHVLGRPLPERSLISPDSHPELLAGARSHLQAVINRYKDRGSIIAWQIEQDSVDPLGLEHSWRLTRSFIEQEVATVRRLDPSRPILLNGFLPTSTPVQASQWWRTRDQGDSVDVAVAMGDLVGLDVYPRHAVASLAAMSVYLDGGRGLLPALRRRRVLRAAATAGKPIVITEGQAEPWEAVTVPPNPDGRAPSSCPPERLIQNYSSCLAWAQGQPVSLWGYLFWGAEYWVLRAQQGDSSYLDAFHRVVSAHRSRTEA